MYTQEVQCGPRKYNLHHYTTNISLNLDPCFHVFTPILPHYPNVAADIELHQTILQSVV